MNKKLLGTILILFGGYLVIGNTILSMIFNYAGPIGYVVPISPINYWLNWLYLYGLYTIPFAVLGIFLFKYGISTLKRNQLEISQIKSNVD